MAKNHATSMTEDEFYSFVGDDALWRTKLIDPRKMSVSVWHGMATVRIFRTVRECETFCRLTRTHLSLSRPVSAYTGC